MYLLTNTVKDYAWGSVDALPDLLGVPRSGRPQAEMWVGAHPSAPSMAHTDDGDRSLRDEIAAAPQRLLGAAVMSRFGAELPFLLKILCADSALSLQVHPSKEQAEHGYAAENAAGTALDAPDRNYRDANHKPELLYALTPFEALCGFAKPAASRALLTQVREHSSADDVLDALIEDLSDGDESVALRRATTRLLTLPTDEAAAAVAVVTAGCEKVPGASAATARELAVDYPGDAGVILSLLLNRVSLQPGEALYLPAGNIHAYLRGTGAEIMATSDNVLRGGLTGKHVDVPELVSILDFRAAGDGRISPVAATDSCVEFRPPVDDFRLSVLDIDGESPGVRWDDDLPRTVIALGGELTLRVEERELALSRGQSAFVAAEDGPVDVLGTGRLLVAAPNL